MDISKLKEIKRLAIIAMFSDDDLMDLLVLKGGNALDIVHQVADRASLDLDFSMEREFEKEEIPKIEDKIRIALERTFREAGYEIFDIAFEERPPTVTENVADFWGGYLVEFKIMEKQEFEALSEDLDAQRRNAMVVGRNQRKKFRIEISKCEYCDPKSKSDFDGYTIYVYTLEMIAFEKLRAICQQMPGYADIVPNPSQSARARDFFDIYTILELTNTDLTEPESQELISDIFKAKRVPLEFLGEIKNQREYHRPDFDSVKDTVKEGVTLRDYDFYFDYVVAKCEILEPLWVV